MNWYTDTSENLLRGWLRRPGERQGLLLSPHATDASGWHSYSWGKLDEMLSRRLRSFRNRPRLLRQALPPLALAWRPAVHEARRARQGNGQCSGLPNDVARREGESRAPYCHGAGTWSTAGIARACAPSQRRPLGQPTGESRTLDSWASVRAAQRALLDVPLLRVALESLN